MSDNHKDSNEGGFHLSTDGLNCLPCKCRKKTFHKEAKINNEGKTTNENRSSWKMGRGITPDENDIFKANTPENEGVDTATTGCGWGSREPTPEERLEKVGEDVERIDKDVNILKNNLNIMD